MPTNSNAYNSRVTDEALEKRFRDTFKAQGGAELVDDLYAQGVIVPIVDFTAAATGQQLAQNLQTAWDFSTGNYQNLTGTYTDVITSSGFWQVDVNYAGFDAGAARSSAIIRINDGSTTKPVWAFTSAQSTPTDAITVVMENSFVVFLRAGDTLEAKAQGTSASLDIWYRQIATVNGDLVNPTGFTSS